MACLRVCFLNFISTAAHPFCLQSHSYKLQTTLHMNAVLIPTSGQQYLDVVLFLSWRSAFKLHIYNPEVCEV